MPRKRHVSRNREVDKAAKSAASVMPRKRHVSRNFPAFPLVPVGKVMPRKRHVSRNL